MWNALFTHTPLLYFIQSLWRDEAFSVLAAKQSLFFIVTRLGFEPPVYYTLLHFWMRIFGESEIAVRSLSVIGFLLATTIVIEWAQKLYKNHWLSWYLPMFFFLNPMLLYYAFEVRTYAWYTFFATAMLYSYTTKRWKWFIATSLLGFYTHVYLLPFIATLFLHWAWVNKRHLRSFPRFYKQDMAFKAFGLIGLIISPWLIKVGIEASRMRSSWYFPVNMQLVKSSLGNMFTGYEGTPWYGWKYTAFVSLFLVLCALVALRDRKQRTHAQLLTVFGALPLAVVIGISFLKPLFVNRYLIPTTVAEIFLIAAAIAAIRIPVIQRCTAALLLIAVVWFNWWYPPQHPKTPIRNTFRQINMIIKPTDIVVASNPIIYLETLYYAKDRSRVYLYNPNNGVFPWYIGDALITPSRMIREYPNYPTRALVVYPNASFEIIYRLPL